MKGMGLKVLAGNVAATFGRQLGSGLLQMVTLAVIARVYGPEGNGAYTVALLLPMMLAALLSLGIGPANVYYLASGQVAPLIAWHATLKIYIFIAFIGLAGGAFALFFYAEQWFPGVPVLLLWFALLIFPVSLLLSFVSSLFQGMQQFKRFNAVLLLQPLLTLVIIVVFVLTGVENIGWLLSAYLLGSVVALWSGYQMLRPYFNDVAVTQEHCLDYGQAVLKYGYKAHISNILTFVNYKADIFLVNFFIGPAGVGIYVISVQLSEWLWLFSQAVSTVLLPRLSQLSSDEGKRNKLTSLVSRWVLLVTAIVAILLAVVAHPVIKLIFGSEYLGAFAPLLLLLPGIVLLAPSRILANDIAARGRPELNMYTTLVVVVINIAGNLILIPGYGLDGAAVATSVSYTAQLLMLLFMHHRLTGVSILSHMIIRCSDLVLLRSAWKKWSGRQFLSR